MSPEGKCPKCNADNESVQDNFAHYKCYSYRVGWQFTQSMVCQIAELKLELAEAERLRDQAVKNANERDAKWMKGIEEVCGCELSFEFDRHPHKPTLGQFIAGLRRRGASDGP